MSSELRRNLFLTIKEALHNVVKHAEASKVHTELYFSGQFLKIVVSDDGKGFDEQKIKSWRNGLFNMRKRIEESGGEFQLTSGLNSGTKIKIEISLGIHSNSH
jgi:signal transduction histidine kinase